ncbi:MAG: tRNA-dihydrouridine synthase, partial [bacterium]
DLTPQLLSNKAQEFIWGVSSLQAFGYREVNLNLGCPAKTVITKKKGSGLLSDLPMLRAFLDEVFEHVDSGMHISIKTRVGFSSLDELPELLDLYNDYPIYKLIVHPRLTTDLYQGKPRLDAFAYIIEHTDLPLVYNGNIFTVQDYHRLLETFPMIEEVMVGRGLIANPALIQEIKGGRRIDKPALKAFHDDLLSHYQNNIHGERNVLFKMKEQWAYWQTLFQDQKTFLKKIRKAHTIAAYQDSVEAFLLNCEIVDDDVRQIMF